MEKYTDLQLRFELKEFDECEADAELRAVTPEEARQISEAARVMFEEDGGRGTGDGGDCFVPRNDKSEDLPWYRDYLRLREQGWPWRVATYIAWASSPKERRWPSTVSGLATEVLGLRGPRVIYTWREKYPAIDAVVAMMQALPLLEHRRDVFDALIAVAMEADYKSHNDRKLFLEMTGDYLRKSELGLGKAGAADDLNELSDEELDALIGKYTKPETDPNNDPHPDPLPSRERETINKEEGDEEE